MAYFSGVPQIGWNLWDFQSRMFTSRVLFLLLSQRHQCTEGLAVGCIMFTVKNSLLCKWLTHMYEISFKCFEFSRWIMRFPRRGLGQAKSLWSKCIYVHSFIYLAQTTRSIETYMTQTEIDRHTSMYYIPCNTLCNTLQRQTVCKFFCFHQHWSLRDASLLFEFICGNSNQPTRREAVLIRFLSFIPSHTTGAWLHLWRTSYFCWPNYCSLQSLLLSHSSTSLYTAIPWFVNCLYHCYLYYSLQTWLL